MIQMGNKALSPTQSPRAPANFTSPAPMSPAA